MLPESDSKKHRFQPKYRDVKWDVTLFRYLAAYVMMTLSDLCSSCKPWETHQIAVEKVFEEFFAQVKHSRQPWKIIKEAPN